MLKSKKEDIPKLCFPHFHLLSISSELEMILSMAETNPGMFNMVANQPEVTKQLDKIGRLKELLMINEAELKIKQKDHWQRWVKQYKYK